MTTEIHNKHSSDDLPKMSEHSITCVAAVFCDWPWRHAIVLFAREVCLNDVNGCSISNNSSDLFKTFGQHGKQDILFLILTLNYLHNSKG